MQGRSEARVMRAMVAYNRALKIISGIKTMEVYIPSQTELSAVLIAADLGLRVQRWKLK